MKKSILYGMICLLALVVTLNELPSSVAENWKKPVDQENLFKTADDWVSKQQYQKALDEVQAIHGQVKAQKDVPNWTRALIRTCLLEQGLHDYETAVRNFRSQEWPKDETAQTLLSLFYAQTLQTYYQGYRYEIDQREKVIAKGEVDLKRWDRHTIFEEIHRTYFEVWKNRETLVGFNVTDFPEYIQRHGYPDNIRSTLRDFLTYQWVEFLSDSSLWSPEHSQDIYLLDFKELLKAKTTISKSEDLISPQLHPLMKISYLLTDLFTWHETRKEGEAGLETTLERIRILSSNFVKDNEQKEIRDTLVSILRRYESFPWWAYGQYELALLFQKKNDLVKAHALAEIGVKRFPESVGGQRCLHLQKAIEAPEFRVQSMSLDRSNARSISIEHKNLARLYFRAYEMDFLKEFKSHGWRALNPGDQINLDRIRSKKASLHWAEDLPLTPDYQLHRTYGRPKLKENAFYLIAASAKEDFSIENNRIDGFLFQTSPYVLLTRATSNGDLEVFVKSGLEGASVSQATIETYRVDPNNHAEEISSEPTDVNGYLKISSSRFSLRQRNFFLLARVGDAYTFDPDNLSLYPRAETTYLRSDFIYTDRSIYRPLQKILFKVVSYDGDRKKGEFKVLPQSPVEITFLDANDQEIAKKILTTNAFGSVSGEFEIPKGRLLGAYSLRTTYGSSSIRIEEYKRPTFQVTLEKPEKALRLNEEAMISGHADYYFGLPVTTGQIKYRVYRERQWPYWYFWRYGWLWSSLSSERERQVGGGKALLKPDGSFRVSFKPEGDADLPDAHSISCRYRIEADVTDEGGETRSSEASYPIGFVAITARVQSNTNFFVADKINFLNVFRTDLSQVPKSGQGKFTLVRLIEDSKTLWPSMIPVEPEKKTIVSPGDQLRPRWEHYAGRSSYLFRLKDGPEIMRGDLLHDQEGKAEIKLNPLQPGTYRLRYQTKDDYEQKFETQFEFLVFGRETSFHLPVYALSERATAQVGEKILFQFGSGDPGQLYRVEIQSRGNLVKTIEGVTAKNPSFVEIPVDDSMRGGVTAQITALHDYQVYSEQVRVHVPWDNKELKLQFETFRDKLKPGQKETWSVTVQGPKSEKIAAELLAYMYDKSLDAFVHHTVPQPLGIYSWYDWLAAFRLNSNQIYASTLFHRDWVGLPGDISISPDQLTSYGGYAIGGPGYRYYRHGLLQGNGELTMEMTASAPMVMGQGESRSKSSNEILSSKVADVAEKKERSVFDSREGNGKRAGEPVPAGTTIRSDFRETAFFQPHLLTDTNGKVKIQFQVPDSVTSWNVFVHALTQDLKSMTLQKEVKTAKDLQVRPYLPRFLREGDEAILRVVVDNATEKTISGQVALEILDPESEKSKLNDFQVLQTKKPVQVLAKQSATVEFPLKAPSRLGDYAFKVTVKAGDQSDGEQRPLPILPGRVHLIQSKFVTLKDYQKRNLNILDLAKSANDPTLIHDSLILNVEAQLFYTVLKALPYLVNYPYECLEQTLNRFLSTGIVTSLYDQYPATKKMAQKFSERKTQLQPWDLQDANRKMSLEELPWLQVAKGGGTENLINVLDAKIARAHREDALEKIRKAQMGSGAWPWFPGGPESPYITLYLLHGFAKAAEFKVEIPKPMIQEAWRYLGAYYRDYFERQLKVEDYCYSFITFLNYVLSCFPDASYYEGAFTAAQRSEMLNYSFSHWKKHNPYNKALLSMTLKRMNRPEDARLVMASIMDSAVTREDEGTHWMREDRSWLWYNDSIETHAFILRALLEVEPQNSKMDGLVLWLFLNKKLNQWKSTKATAEVIYSLAYYLKSVGALGIREEVAVKWLDKNVSIVFSPDEYTGKNQVVIPGPEVQPAMSEVTVENKGKGTKFASLTWHYSTEKIPEEERGDFFWVKRGYFLRENQNGQFVLKPISEGTPIKVGDQVEVQLSLRTKHASEYVHLRDPRGAGFEPEKPVSGYRYDLGIGWYEEVRDSGTNFFFEQLPQGEYQFRYRLRASMAGTFKAGPATLQSMYAPEFNAFSSGANLKVRSQ